MGYERRNGKLGEMEQKGDDDQLARAVWLRLHYSWLRRKPHGLVHGRGPSSAPRPGLSGSWIVGLRLGTKDHWLVERDGR